SLPQYLAVRAGSPAKRDPFEGVDLTWKRYPGGEGVGALLAQAEKEFDARRPAASLPLLAKAHAAMQKLPADPLLERKRQDLEAVMASCAGLWLEAVSGRPSVTPGDPVAVATAVLMRTPAPVTLASVAVGEVEHAGRRTLQPNVAAADSIL